MTTGATRAPGALAQARGGAGAAALPFAPSAGLAARLRNGTHGKGLTSRPEQTLSNLP